MSRDLNLVLTFRVVQWGIIQSVLPTSFPNKVKSIIAFGYAVVDRSL